jgi:RluA family pseudouridine synthase
LYLDNHLLVVDKPSGLLVQGDSSGRPDLLSEAKQFIKHKFAKPGNVFVGLVHRLDRPVSGVVVFARTSKAAARLSAQFRERQVHKRYLALVQGRVTEPGSLRHHLRKQERRVAVVRPGTKGALEALMDYRPLKVIGRWSLLEVVLKTGRPHQIRVQLSASGFPILGDTMYGAEPWLSADEIGLHCWQISLTHPTRKEIMEWTAAPPPSWPVEAIEFASSGT